MVENDQSESFEEKATPADQPDDLVDEAVRLTESKANTINADQVTMAESMASEINAREVDMAQSLAMRIQSDTVELNNSGVGLLQANTVAATNAQVMVAQINQLNAENVSLGVVSAGTAEIVNGHTGVLMTRELHGEAIRSTVLLAGKVDGNVETVLDTPRAMLVGLTAGIAIGLVFLVSNVLLRRK